MNFIKKWFSKPSEYGINEAVKGSDIFIERDVKISPKPMQSDPVLTFVIFDAVGGKIVEFRRFDKKTGDNNTTLYVIGHDDDFGDRIAKIAMLETFK